MPRPRPLALLAALVALPAGLGAQTGKPPPSFEGGGKPAAIPAPGPPAPAEAGVTEEDLRPAPGDPPVLVGRVARSAGGASFQLPGSEAWQPATLNTAVTPGTAFWTEPGGRLALEAGEGRIFLDGGTALRLDALEEAALRGTLAAGIAALRLRGTREAPTEAEIATPEARLLAAADGLYLLEAASPDGTRPGLVAVIEGAAEVIPAGAAAPIRLGPGEALRLPPGGAGERERFAGTSPLLAWALGPPPRRALPPSVRGMTGAEELAGYGAWDRSPEYGDVWLPPVAAEWQPYSDGAWHWRDPWGWTWVDAAPWGFAPSHYGRWVRVGPRWGWAPEPVRLRGPRPRPAWTPAVVAFFGAPGPARHAGPARPVGWVPLAPREPWYPWYRASPRYVQRMNIRQVANLVEVREEWSRRGGREMRWDEPRPVPSDRRLDALRHRRAALEVPERVMLSSLPVRPEARRPPPEATRGAALLPGLPLRPAPETRGVTGRAAERLGLPPEAFRAGPDRPSAAMPPSPLRAALAERGAEEGRRRAEEARRDAEDRARRQAEDASRQADEMRRQQMEGARRQQEEGARRNADEMRRQQMEGARRQQEEGARRQADEMRRQQMEGARRQQEEGARRQADEMRRQQMEGARRQQEEGARRQADEMRRQQMEGARRQQEEGARRQADEMRRQQMEGARRQQEEQSRRQAEGMRRQQEEGARRQAEEARRRAEEQARRQR